MQELLNKDWNFKESDYLKQVNKIRATVESEVSEGRAQVNSGAISEPEFNKTKSNIVAAGNTELKKVLRAREAAINEQELAYSRKLAGVEGSDLGTLKEFRANYEDLLKRAGKDKNDLIKSYKTSLRLGDEVGLRAAGLAGYELGIREVAADFQERSPEFAETAAEAARFNKRYRDTVAKFTDRIGEYRHIDTPQERKEPVQSGFVIDPQSGVRMAHYKNRLYKK